MKIKKDKYYVTGGKSSDAYLTIDTIIEITKTHVLFRCIYDLDGRPSSISSMNVPHHNVDSYINRELTALEILMLDFQDKI